MFSFMKIFGLSVSRSSPIPDIIWYFHEACATRLCSHTFSVDLNSMALAWAVVGAVGTPDESAKEGSYFHVHGSHLYVSLAWSFPFSLLWPTLLTCSSRARVAATTSHNPDFSALPRFRIFLHLHRLVLRKDSSAFRRNTRVLTAHYHQ